MLKIVRKIIYHLGSNCLWFFFLFDGLLHINSCTTDTEMEVIKVRNK